MRGGSMRCFELIELMDPFRRCWLAGRDAGKARAGGPPPRIEELVLLAAHGGEQRPHSDDAAALKGKQE